MLSDQSLQCFVAGDDETLAEMARELLALREKVRELRNSRNYAIEEWLTRYATRDLANLRWVLDDEAVYLFGRDV